MYSGVEASRVRYGAVPGVVNDNELVRRPAAEGLLLKLTQQKTLTKANTKCLGAIFPTNLTAVSLNGFVANIVLTKHFGVHCNMSHPINASSAMVSALNLLARGGNGSTEAVTLSDMHRIYVIAKQASKVRVASKKAEVSKNCDSAYVAADAMRTKGYLTPEESEELLHSAFTEHPEACNTSLVIPLLNRSSRFINIAQLCFLVMLPIATCVLIGMTTNLRQVLIFSAFILGLCAVTDVAGPIVQLLHGVREPSFRECPLLEGGANSNATLIRSSEWSGSCWRFACKGTLELTFLSASVNAEVAIFKKSGRNAEETLLGPMFTQRRYTAKDLTVHSDTGNTHREADLLLGAQCIQPKDKFPSRRRVRCKMIHEGFGTAPLVTTNATSRCWAYFCQGKLTATFITRLHKKQALTFRDGSGHLIGQFNGSTVTTTTYSARGRVVVTVPPVSASIVGDPSPDVLMTAQCRRDREE